MLYDVLVIGAGAAGLTAALHAANSGAKVGLVTKTNPLRSNSSMAAGGINASLATMEEDSEALHIGDTIRGGANLNDKMAVAVLCKNAPDAVKELLSYGVGFDKKDDGELMQRSFGGAGKKRTCYVADKTGAAIVQTLIVKAKQAGVQFINDHFVLSILQKDGRISGVTTLKKSTSDVVVLVAKAFVFAGGGFAGIYRGHTTNPGDANGDLLAVALRAKLRLSDMEFVQFHPTGLGKSGSLVSESVRGEGGYIVNEKGERFVDELATRDVVSKAIAKQIAVGHKVFIDARHLGEELINARLPSFRKAAVMSEGVDPAKELVEIKPVAHYTMGGIETNELTETKLNGLYVCGECAASGVHGANRLGGNSLLETVVFGKIAGLRAAAFAKKHGFLDISYEAVAKDMQEVESILAGDNRFNVNALKKSLGAKMFAKVGIFRDERVLEDAFDYIKYLRRLTSGLACIDKSRDTNVELIAILEFKNSLDVAEAVTMSALARQESRGAHTRLDYPNRDDKSFFKRSFLLERRKGYFEITFEDGGSLMQKIKRRLKWQK